MKIFKLVILLFLSILLASCTVVEGETKERIIAPSNNTPPIQGRWEVVERVYGSSTEEDTFIGTLGLFHEKGVVIGEEFTNEPSFKIKKVKAKDYLIYKHKISPSSLKLEGEYVYVISIYNQGLFFNEFVQLNEDTILYGKDDNFYKLVRLQENVSIEEVERYIIAEKSVQNNLVGVQNEAFSSGLLLGMKVQTFDEINQVSNWEYKTIWINMQDSRLAGAYELDRLLVPRKNGFWFVDQVRSEVNGVLQDDIIATPLFALPEEIKPMDGLEIPLDEEEELVVVEERPIPSILKNILFVGNDYISVENIDLDRNDRRTLQVYAIDNLKNKQPIKLTDIIGETGRDLFIEGVRTVTAIEEGVVPNEENFGLTRRNGYWTIKGRINIKQNNEELFKDFNIKAIPPKDMVSYDEQSIPWDAVRLTVADVNDVFTSPNNEFIVVITTSHIVIYTLEGYDINISPLKTIRLPNDASIVMAEWGVGRYPQIWENEMIKHGAEPIE